MSEVKEPSFFDEFYDRGVEFYASHFVGHRSEKAIGEISPWSMRWPHLPERVAQVIPNAKVIFLLRNPIDRAFSNYNMYLMSKTPPKKTFSEVIRSGNISRDWRKFPPDLTDGLDDRWIIWCGFYRYLIENFHRYFKTENTLVVLTEDLKADRYNTLRKVFEFLGVDPAIQVEEAKDFLVSKRIRSAKVWSFVFPKYLRIEKLFMESPLKPVWQWTKRLRSSASKLIYARIPPMLPEDRAFLRELYDEHNRSLSKYLNLELRRWK